MVVILVIMTFAAAIFIEYALRQRARRREAVPEWARREGLAASPSPLSLGRAEPLQFPRDLYYHNGHAWAKLNENGKVTIGLDDLTQKVMGEIEKIDTPPLGKEIDQGEVAWKIWRGRRKLNQLAPLSGTVVEINEKLKEQPSLANRSPYGEGWILKIKPKALGNEIPKLMDSFQMKLYLDEVKAGLRSYLSREALGTVYGDGEEILACAADKLDEKWWRILVSHLFRTTGDA